MPSLRITTHPRVWYSGIPWYQIPLTFPERFGVTSVYDLYIEKTGYFPMVSKQLKSSNSEKLLRLKLFSYSVLESSACSWGKKKKSQRNSSVIQSFFTYAPRAALKSFLPFSPSTWESFCITHFFATFQQEDTLLTLPQSPQPPRGRHAASVSPSVCSRRGSQGTPAHRRTLG